MQHLSLTVTNERVCFGQLCQWRTLPLIRCVVVRVSLISVLALLGIFVVVAILKISYSGTVAASFATQLRERPQIGRLT